jgi:hypothetical protein
LKIRKPRLSWDEAFFLFSRCGFSDDDRNSRKGLTPAMPGTTLISMEARGMGQLILIRYGGNRPAEGIGTREACGALFHVLAVRAA